MRISRSGRAVHAALRRTWGDWHAQDLWLVLRRWPHDVEIYLPALSDRQELEGTLAKTDGMQRLYPEDRRDLRRALRDMGYTVEDSEP